MMQLEVDYMNVVMAELKEIAESQKEIAESLKKIADSVEPNEYEKIRRSIGRK